MNEQRIRIAFRESPAIIEQLSSIAEREGSSLSTIVRHAVRLELQARERRDSDYTAERV